MSEPLPSLSLLLVGLVTAVLLLVTAALVWSIWSRRGLARQTASLVARIRELETSAAAQQEQVQAVLDSGAKQELKLDRYRKANVEFKHALERSEAMARASQEELEALRRDLFVQRRHTVFLDGMPGAGKTTFLERLTNPTATPEQLLQQTSTQYPYHTDPIPLCWEVVDGLRVLHTLEFFDIGGEHPQHVIDNILMYRDRKLSSHGRALALVLWDTAAGHPTNVGYLNTGRMSAVYGPRIARETISALHFFFNKCDLVEQAGSRAHLEEVVSLQRRILLTEVFDKSLNGYPVPLFTHGSALTGSGVHACLGQIVRALGLEHVYGRAGSPANEAASAG